MPTPPDVTLSLSKDLVILLLSPLVHNSIFKEQLCRLYHTLRPTSSITIVYK
jgi:hypothetical protein